MSYISYEFDKSLSGVTTITDGLGAIIQNGEIECNRLFINGVEIINNSSGSATVNVGTTTTLSAGSNATVTNSGTETNAILNFGIPQGLQGPQGIQGETGQGFTYLGAYSNSTQYFPYDVVNYNGSSYVNIIQSYNIQPTNISYWNIIAQKGDTGNQGNQGSKGEQGEQGPKGEKGDDGQDGTSVDIGDVVGIVVATLGIATLEGQIATLQGQMTAVQGVNSVQDLAIETLENKVQNQSATIGTTNFSGNVNINNGVSNKIILNSDGDIDCQSLETQDDITCGDKLTANQIISNGNIEINNSSLKVNSAGVTNAEIKNNGEVKCENVVANTFKPNNLLNSIIIGDVLGTVTINGLVTMPQMGFSITNGYINQF